MFRNVVCILIVEMCSMVAFKNKDIFIVYLNPVVILVIALHLIPHCCYGSEFS